MATKNQPSTADLATLDLARAVATDDYAAAVAALKAGAVPVAYWIDGKTTLAELAELLGRSKIAKAIEPAATPDAMRRVPDYYDDREWWTEGFIKFAMARGFNIAGYNIRVGGGYGRKMPAFGSATAAIRFVAGAERPIDNASCKDAEGGAKSEFRIAYGPDWTLSKKGREKRKPGFWIIFEVDMLGWDLFEKYQAAQKDGTWHVDPDGRDPSMWNQKHWEGEAIARHWIEGKASRSFDNYIAMLRKGGSPFILDRDRKHLLYRYCEMSSAQFAFLDRLRSTVGPEIGWHVRIIPLLTQDAVRSGVEAEELARSA